MTKPSLIEFQDWMHQYDASVRIIGWKKVFVRLVFDTMGDGRLGAMCRLLEYLTKFLRSRDPNEEE